MIFVAYAALAAVAGGGLYLWSAGKDWTWKGLIGSAAAGVATTAAITGVGLLLGLGARGVLLGWNAKAVTTRVVTAAAIGVPTKALADDHAAPEPAFETLHTAAPTGAPPFLENGSTGPWVTRLHALLRDAGFLTEAPAQVDRFDEGTAAALRAFQTQRLGRRLTSGTDDHRDFAALEALLAGAPVESFEPGIGRKDRGQRVSRLQTLLRDTGHLRRLRYQPGYFDEATEAALLRFQAEYYEPRLVTGVADSRDLELLESMAIDPNASGGLIRGLDASEDDDFDSEDWDF